MNPKQIDHQIRSIARKQNLTARCKTHVDKVGAKERHWYIADENNILQSYQGGLYDHEALKWLKQ